MKRRIQIAAGLALGLVLVWFLFKDTDWNELWQAVAEAKWSWLLLSQVPLWVSFFTRAQRWSYIVRATGPARFRHLFSATQIGFLVNFVLPARMGELVRPLVLSRLTGRPFTQSLAMTALDRVADLVGLLAVMIVATLSFRPTGDIHLPPAIWDEPLPAELIRTGAWGTLIVIILIVAALVLLYVNTRYALRLSDAVVGVFSQRAAAYVHGMLAHFAGGLDVFRSVGDLVKTCVFSLITWGCFLLAYQCAMEAFEIAAPWYTVFVMVAFLAVAISLPSAPGGFGLFQLAIVATFAVLALDVSYPKALALSLVAHVINLVPITIAGLYCLYRENLSFVSVTRQSVQTHEEPTVL
jgi:glycosyltransferase 2 family protein